MDGSAPSISITTPASGATYAPGQAVDASYSCTDPDGPGDVASCSGPVASGTPIDTFTAGAHTFTVTSTDQVGNRSSQTVSYTVSAPGGGGTPPPSPGGGTPPPSPGGGMPSLSTSGLPST